MPEPVSLGKTLFTIGKYVLGLFLTARQARNARRQQQAIQRANSTIELNQSGAGQTIQSVYGYMSISMQSVFSRPNNSFTRPTDGLSHDLNDRNWHGTLQSGSSGSPQYALFQYPISIGQMQSFIDVIIDGEPTPRTYFTHMLFGETPAYASAFRPDNNNATFTQLTYINGVYQQRLSDPQYASGEVRLRAVVQGRRVPVLESDDNGVTVTVSDTPAYRNDMPSVLLDYLTSQDVGVGPAMDINEDIDLPSFYRAIQQARVVVENDFFSRNFAGQPSFTSHLLRHEFNGSLPSDHDFPAAITRILSVVPGSLLFRSHLTGKYKLVLPHATNDTNKTYTTGNGGLIGPVEVTQPGPDDSLTRIHGTFTNARKDFTQDTAIYPEAGSPAATDLINRHRGRRTSTSVDLHGVNNFNQAYSVLYTMLQFSSRVRYTATLSPDGFWHEPGDIITIQDDLIGPDLINVYVLDTDLDENFNNTIEGFAWVASDVAYQSSATEVLPPRQTIDRSWPAPSLTEPLVVNNTYRDIDIILEPADNEPPAVVTYEYEYQLDGTWEGWITSSSRRVRFAIPNRGGTFRFRARARGFNRVSPWSTETAAVTVAEGSPASSAAGIEQIYAKINSGDTVTQPDNAWGYKTRPAPTNALNVWFISAPNLSAGQVLLSSQRDIIGAPATGDAVADEWTPAAVVGGFGSDGADGADGTDGSAGLPGPAGRAGSDGNPGSDGQGREWIFIAWNSDSNPPTVPASSVLYDMPGGGWTDEEPNTDSVNRYIWWTSRLITGDPSPGDAIGTAFNPPQLLPQGQDGQDGDDGSDGRDGSDGSDGQDGFGIEECFALVGMNRNSFTSSERPDNNWVFGDWPGNGYLRASVLWRCDRPAPTMNHPRIFRSWRRIPASLSIGSAIPNSGLSQPRSFYNWQTPELLDEGSFAATVPPFLIQVDPFSVSYFGTTTAQISGDRAFSVTVSGGTLTSSFTAQFETTRRRNFDNNAWINFVDVTQTSSASYPGELSFRSNFRTVFGVTQYFVAIEYIPEGFNTAHGAASLGLEFNS